MMHGSCTLHLWSMSINQHNNLWFIALAQWLWDYHKWLVNFLAEYTTIWNFHGYWLWPISVSLPVLFSPVSVNETRNGKSATGFQHRRAASKRCKWFGEHFSNANFLEYSCIILGLKNVFLNRCFNHELVLHLLWGFLLICLWFILQYINLKQDSCMVLFLAWGTLLTYFGELLTPSWPQWLEDSRSHLRYLSIHSKIIMKMSSTTHTPILNLKWCSLPLFLGDTVDLSFALFD